ncbi:MAG: ABC transporter ATP-binding protein [Acidimicrobiia bacterium]|nr:ABC transporter ATP-binding protein [Acidimicrobiia bacterium]MDH4308224.1 ABC transporter ATP-binding protein [Acidimicrobiia bacterium]MDH5292990.1 ABC transporter ATP-binding protein [Acidimicrobiia bacterium]
MADSVLEIKDLVVEFDTTDGVVHAVDGVSYEVAPGETLGVVGESGSGKSVTVMSALGLIQMPPGRIVRGEVLYNGRNLIGLPIDELRKIRNKEIGMVFQDPMTSLNPVFTVGDQIAEAILEHNASATELEARKRTIGLLERVGVPNAERRFDQYPHEYSGGMRQRAMIAMAIANDPAVIIADEPTTALDVTIQAQVLDVLKDATRETHAALILITHDLGVVAELVDKVAVMYAGKVVERGSVEEIFHAPRHPYTLGLMMSLPRLSGEIKKLLPIAGNPPSLLNRPAGCSFHPRCRLYHGREICRTDVPELPGGTTAAACHFTSEMAAELEREAAEAGIAAEGGRIG